MRPTPAMAIARRVAGYRPPAADEPCCAKCGAVREGRGERQPYYCTRHMFYVHSRGICPRFSAEPYVPPVPKAPRFAQGDFFNDNPKGKR